MIGYLLAAFVTVLLISNGITWHYTQKSGAVKLAAFQAQVEAAGNAKDLERGKIELESAAQAAKLRGDLQRRELELDAAVKKQRATLVQLNGVVRDLADLRRVLDPGGSKTAEDAPAAVRSDSADPGADLARRLVACEHALTVSAETAGVNNVFHKRALMARDACVAQYNNFRALNNEGD